MGFAWLKAQEARLSDMSRVLHVEENRSPGRRRQFGLCVHRNSTPGREDVGERVEYPGTPLNILDIKCNSPHGAEDRFLIAIKFFIWKNNRVAESIQTNL